MNTILKKKQFKRYADKIEFQKKFATEVIKRITNMALEGWLDVVEVTKQDDGRVMIIIGVYEEE